MQIYSRMHRCGGNTRVEILAGRPIRRIGSGLPRLWLSGTLVGEAAQERLPRKGGVRMTTGVEVSRPFVVSGESGHYAHANPPCESCEGHSVEVMVRYEDEERQQVITVYLCTCGLPRLVLRHGSLLEFLALLDRQEVG